MWGSPSSAATPHGTWTSGEGVRVADGLGGGEWYRGLSQEDLCFAVCASGDAVAPVQEQDGEGPGKAATDLSREKPSPELSELTVSCIPCFHPRLADAEQHYCFLLSGSLFFSAFILIMMQ